MKPSAFTYHAPKTLAEALDLVAGLDNARVLAGGQSLMPMMNYRVVQPEHLIDLGRIPELAFIEDTADGLKIGAMTTQRSIERSKLVHQKCPLLTDALFHVGHQQTRNRGTIGGSICHLDPSAELPVTACALDAEMTVASTTGRRTIAFADFPAGYLTTSLEPGEILVAVDFGQWPDRAGSAFEEYAVRPADFAIVSIAAVIAVGDGDVIMTARLAAGGIAPIPTRLTSVEALLKGERVSDALIARAAAEAAALPAAGDDANPPDYRRELAGHLTQRALTKAVQRARERAHAREHA
jgi:aerobic carbon-monoxide dehydrogenase medium subunit